MKFIVDAHLPVQLVNWLRNEGHDVIHTRELPNANLTDDKVIINISIKEQRIVISKDRDFWNYFVLHRQPHKLLMITTGNINNADLIKLFKANFPQIELHFQAKDVVELDNFSVTIHF